MTGSPVIICFMPSAKIPTNCDCPFSFMSVPLRKGNNIEKQYMKRILIIMAVMAVSLSASAKVVEKTFTVRGHCGMCKSNIEKVSKGLNDAIKYVETGELPADYYDEPEPTPRSYDHVEDESHSEIDSAIDKWFDNLDK